MIDNRTNTTIYMYPFYSNWEKEDKKLIESLNFDNFYLGDMEYKHYNYFVDFDYFQKDNIIFGVLSGEKNKDFNDTIELLKESKMTVAFYDITHYMFNPDTDEKLIDGEIKTMFVFKVTGTFIKTLEKFKLSKYSLMYTKYDLGFYFNSHIPYLIKIIKEGDKEVNVTLENYKEIFANINLETDINEVKISYYHILNKSPELGELLGKLYLMDFTPNMELKSKLKYEQEIYNYDKVMYQDLRLN